MPPARETFAVIACPAVGSWGYEYGLNEHQLALGCVNVSSVRDPGQPNQQGPDLVRLALERCRSARQAVDLIIGQLAGLRAKNVATAGDSAFTVADPHEAFAIETAHNFWVYQQLCETRAVSAIRIIRQDWDRIAPGLGDHAIAQGWWPADGSKLDFAAALGAHTRQSSAAWRRWSRATVLLQEQNESIDAGFIRRILADHGDEQELDAPEAYCRHHQTGGDGITVASMVATLGAEPDSVAYARCAFGPPCRSIYFSLFPGGDVPPVFLGEPGSAETRGSRLLHAQIKYSPRAEEAGHLQKRQATLQEMIDRKTEEFLLEARKLKEAGDVLAFRHQASMFMEHQLEMFEVALVDPPSAHSALRGPLAQQRPEKVLEETRAMPAGFFG
jgi:hypothetical protein